MERRQSLPLVMSSRFSSSITTTTTKLDAAAAARLSSAFSDHNSSSFRRKSISFNPYKNYDVDESPNPPSHPSANSSLHRTPLSTTTVVAAVPSSPRRLQKQSSSDDIQSRGLWPSTKKPNPSAAAAADGDAATEALYRHLDDERHTTEAAEINYHIPPQRPSATYNASTFTSRQHKSSEPSVALEDKRGDRGRRSLRYHILKKPGTPPSPSSSSSSSNGLPPSAPTLPGRLSLNGAARARKRSDFGIDFTSTESERSEAAAPSPRTTKGLGKVDGRRPSSPAQGPGLPAKGKSSGMGSLISQGLSNLFRRKSISGVNGESLKLMLSTAAGVGSPGRQAAITVKAIGSPGKEMVKAAKSIGSPARETIKAGISMGSPARAGAVEGELQHKLRMMRNYLMQWRFVNAGALLINKIKWVNTQRTLVSAWLGLSDLQLIVAQKRLQLEKEKLRYKVNKLLYHQTKALERWGTMERQHMAALSSTKDSLQTAVCRIPLTDNAKVDQCSLSTLLQQATNLTAAINGNIATCNSRARSTAPLVAELAQVVAREKPLLEECLELLGLVSTLQVHEESLRCHLIQLKPQ